MCGIVAYAGKDQAAPFLIEGLKRLEYRGYDSFGLATMSGSNFVGARRLGAISQAELHPSDFPGHAGIAHTRWATHGAVTVENAHPIAGGHTGSCKVVHNGVIKNYRALRIMLEQEGYTFKTETDTEVIAHLFAKVLSTETTLSSCPPYHFGRGIIPQVLAYLEGDYAFAVICREYPDIVGFACNGSPLVWKLGGFVASDPIALAGMGETSHHYRMQDGQIGVFSRSGIYPWVFDKIGIAEAGLPPKQTDPTNINQSSGQDAHFMLKEILEQTKLLRKPIGRDVNIGNVSQIVLFGCGSSYYAATMAKHWFQDVSGVQTTVEYASELSERKLGVYPQDTLFIGITQSGETKDTIEALKHCRAHTKNVWLITNNDHAHTHCARIVFYLDCGQEVGVAATKTFTETALVLAELAIDKNGTDLTTQSWLHTTLPNHVEMVLKQRDKLEELGKKIAEYNRVLYLARGSCYPAACEGALKLKEVSYIHAEAIHAGEMKHGPIALVDDKTLSIFIVNNGVDRRVITNMEEIKARGGKILAIHDVDSALDVFGIADFAFEIPRTAPFAQPILATIPLQLLAYYAAVARGLNPDRPRNLAKSVSVE